VYWCLLNERAEEEDVEISEDGQELLVQIAVETSLRYAIQLITTSNIVAIQRKSSQVEVQDIRRVYSMFVDVKRSIEYLNEQQELYLFSEANPNKIIEE
jgi:RuvB-like protein 2